MIVVDLIQIILCYHPFQVALHFISAEICVRVDFLVTANYILVFQAHISQLVPQSQPPRHAVVRPTKKLNLFATFEHPLDHTVNFIRLSTCFSNFGYDNITV